MKYISFLFFVSLSLGFAEDIDTLIQYSYDNNFALKMMQKDVDINLESIKSSDSWKNPTISVGMSDILLDNIGDRSIEPMQTQLVSISQIIPLGDKKEISKNIFQTLASLSKFKIEDKKRDIASKITTLAYKSKIITKKLSLLLKKRKNLYKIKKLLKAYQKDREDFFDIDIKILKLKNIEQSLNYQIDEIKNKIEKLTVVPFSDIKLLLEIKNIPIVSIKNHPKIEFLRQNIILKKEKNRLALSKKIADIKLSGGYYQRESRDDYINISLSMPLHVRGIEEVEVIKSKLAIQKSQSRFDDVKNIFEKDIASLNKKLQISATNYMLFREKLLPSQNKIIELTKRKHRNGRTNLIEVLKKINQKIRLEELSLDELKNYFEAYGKLRYYQ